MARSIQVGDTYTIVGPTFRTSFGDGLEVTELGDGGYYFAPPGDFSKVDFSACRELGESVNFAATQNQLPPKSGQVTFNIHSTIGVDIGEEAWKRVAAAISRRLSKAADYGSYMVSGGPATGFQSFARMGGEGGFLDPNTLPSKAAVVPKTAQQQAKPALPSLMTEAGERYQGLGWCDE